MSVVYDIWRAIGTRLQEIPSLQGAEIILTSSIRDHDVQHPVVFVVGVNTARVEPKVDRHQFVVRIRVKDIGSIADTTVFERILGMGADTRKTLLDNTLNSLVYGGVQIAGGGLTHDPEDPLLQEYQMTLICDEWLDPENPALSRLQRFYWGEPTYVNGNYGDVSWSELCRNENLSIRPWRSNVTDVWINSSIAVGNQQWGREKWVVNTHVQQLDTGLLALFFATESEDGKVPMLHTKAEASIIPKKAGLLVNVRSDGSFAKLYFPRMQALLREQNQLPTMDYEWTSIYDSQYSDSWQYGIAEITDVKNPWID